MAKREPWGNACRGATVVRLRARDANGIDLPDPSLIPAVHPSVAIQEMQPASLAVVSNFLLFVQTKLPNGASKIPVRVRFATGRARL